jgi:hypothetical protein
VSDQDKDVDAHELTDELAKKYDPERLLKIVAAKAGKGDALDASLRHRYEKRFGVDLGHVRLFNGEFAERFARERGAYALTVGNTGMVMMGNSPDKSMASADGQALLAHELTHVAQQSRNAGGGLHRKAVVSMPFAEEHEVEAEEHELDVRQSMMGQNWQTNFEESKMSPKAKEQGKQRLEKAIEKIHDRVVDMMGEAVRNQSLRNGGGSRRA